MTRVFIFDKEGKILLATNINDNSPYIIVLKEGGSIYKYVNPEINIIKNSLLRTISRMI